MDWLFWVDEVWFSALGEDFSNRKGKDEVSVVSQPSSGELSPPTMMAEVY